MPLLLLSLEKDLSPQVGFLISALRVLLWPVSALAIGMQGPITLLSTVLLNVATYLVLGGLVWLGLRPPRSITFLTMVGIIYLTAVSVAGLCEWLLA